MKLFKKIRIIPLSYNGESTIEIPDGFQFDRVITIETISPQYTNSSPYAVMLEEATLQELAKKMQKGFDDSLASREKYFAEQYEKKIKSMDLLQAFSDLVSKFRVGDTAYYYSEYTRGFLDGNLIESHIESFTINSIELRDNAVRTIEKSKSPDDYKQEFYAVNYNSVQNVTTLYKTKEEAIEGSKEYHEQLQKLKADARLKSDAEAILRKREEEAEILRKAEDIKSKLKQQ